MMHVDYTALVCDMAETYHIYDLELLPIETVAILACGLREDSRIMQKASGVRLPNLQTMLASVADNLSIIRGAYMDEKSNYNPYLFTEHMKEDIEIEEQISFMNFEEFKAEWDAINRGEG